MNLLILLAAVSLAGAEVGWEPLPDGGIKYIIQLDPATIDAIRSGEPFDSFIPTDVQNVRAYQIVVGKKTLPRMGAAPQNASTPTTVAKQDFNDFPKALLEAPKLPKSTFSPSTEAMVSSYVPTNAAGNNKGHVDGAKSPATGVVLTQNSLPPGSSAEMSLETQKPTLPPTTEAAPSAEPKPWLPLILVSLTLFASLGGNLYLGWLFAELRRRYRSMLRGNKL